MEGSPVRGQEKIPIMRLNEAQSIQSFHAELVRLIGTELPQTETFIGVLDAGSKTLQFPSWVKAHLDRHPGLYRKLEQGEMVGISHSEENAVLRPVGAVRSSVVLIPIISDGTLQGAIGLVAPLDGSPLSAEDIEFVRQLAYESAPVVVRLQEIERLRRENKELAALKASAAQAREDLDKALQEKQSLDAVIQMRSHQQANVAHELRTPLAAVRGYARMILDGRGGEINDTQRDYLRIVTENTNRLISLVGWMSYVAELSAQHLVLSTFDLRDVWKESVADAQEALTQKSLQLGEKIPNESFSMTGDREKMAYVLSELLTMAARFSATAGTISAEFSHGREREITVKLSEKGESIPPEALSRIFERSFNTIAKPTAQSTDDGAISLSGVYDVVGMHGGRIFVNSTAGQSTTFLFTLPAVTAGGEENSHEQAVNSGRRRR
jgi:signal transduction histidine kinase